MMLIVLVIVEGYQCPFFLEAFHKHALGVEVGEAQGSLYFLHTPLFAPFLDRLQQGCGHFGIIDEINPAEADLPAFPSFVRAWVDDCRAASDKFSVLISKEIFGLAKFECGILLPVKSLEIVGF